MAKIYKSKRGIPIDIESVRMQNERTVAAGNANMNARGDTLGKGGKIVKKASQTARVQRTEAPKGVSNVSIKGKTDDNLEKQIKSGIGIAPNKKSPPPAESKPSKQKEITLENGDIIVVDENQDPDPEFN